MHPLRISAPQHRSGVVAADVAGTQVSFSSPDAELRPAAEAFAGAMWLPALHGGVELVLAAPADKTWQTNLIWAAALARSWWGFGSSRLRTAGARPTSPPADATVLCFTGGVDSFYSLLGGSPRPDAVVFAHGFDIGLGDEDRWRHAERGMRAVAAALGMQAIVIRSDLRSHPGFASIS